ncbi:MAG TPA: APC family permease [Terriglobales bacterium]|nr:APC family permease [Terriglobales bacterium]
MPDALPAAAPPAACRADRPHLIRGIGLGEATALNMIDMIGVGPFITIPLIISAMGGPQAMLGWILGAFFAICDGLVWAELGAAMPGSGGSYRYLKEIYGPDRWGRLLSFLFVWQLSFSAPLSVASGCIGLARYCAYLWPGLESNWISRSYRFSPLPGSPEIFLRVSGSALLAVGVCLLAVWLLYRRITSIGALSKLLWAGVLGTVGWVIFAGVTHFNSARALDFPAGAFSLNGAFFAGLASAMLIATYDYWGYYNVCFIGEEIKDPGRNIPRALIYSILAVAVLYLVMNISVLGIIPWRELDSAAKSESRFYVMSVLMQRTYGAWAANLITVLIMWTAFASVFSLLLGYSRVPYAAALDGNYFKAFARLHPRYHFPSVSLLALGAVAAVFCFFRLADIIAALVVIRIMIQFLVQAIGVIVLRIRRPEMPRPFRMWFYPLPALLASIGFLYILSVRGREITYGLVILLAGLVIYIARSWRRGEWPFSPPAQTIGTP